MHDVVPSMADDDKSMHLKGILEHISDFEMMNAVQIQNRKASKYISFFGSSKSGKKNENCHDTILRHLTLCDKVSVQYSTAATSM